MTLEEFIMENIDWINLVIAAVTLLGVVGTAIVTVLQLCKSEKTTRELLSKDHQGLSKDHQGLSTTISEKHMDLKERQNEIKQTVTYLKENAIEENVKKQVLSQEMLDIKQTSDHIAALVDLLHNTQIENFQLRQENISLQQRLQEYELHNDEEDMEL